MSSLLFKILSVAGAAGISATASATLTIDLRVVSVNGVPEPNPKSFCLTPGASVVFDVYAIVTAATEGPGLEGFQIAIGSIVSSNGGGWMDMVSGGFVAPFGAAGSTVGLRADLDGDGDLDIGSNNTALEVNFIGARSASMTTGNANGLGASEFRFYTFTGLISPAASGFVSVNWRKTDLTGLTTEYVWQENGVLTNSRGVNGGSVPLVQVGPPIFNVLFCIPEPSASGLAVLGAMGLAGFRRDRRG